jgi:hypothetical protein
MPQFTVLRISQSGPNAPEEIVAEGEERPYLRQVGHGGSPHRAAQPADPRARSGMPAPPRGSVHGLISDRG